MNKILQWRQQRRQRCPAGPAGGAPDWPGAPPAGSAGVPLLPLLQLLWYSIHTCSLPYVLYYFLFDLVCYLYQHFCFYPCWIFGLAFFQMFQSVFDLFQVARRDADLRAVNPCTRTKPRGCIKALIELRKDFCNLNLVVAELSFCIFDLYQLVWPSVSQDCG